MGITDYLLIEGYMDRNIYNSDFDRDEVYKRLNRLSEELEEEQGKDMQERDFEKERDLMYATLIQGLKLNVLYRK